MKVELSAWVVETGIFNKNIEDLTEEINGAGDVLAFLNNANF